MGINVDGTITWTADLVETGEPDGEWLEWTVDGWYPMGEDQKDFTFRADGTVHTRTADGSRNRVAHWRWTKGRLPVSINDNGWRRLRPQAAP